MAATKRTSRKVWDELLAACWTGNLEFVSQCIAKDRDRGQNVDWDRLMETAFDRKHMDIVRCIRDSRRVSIDKQFNHACKTGDVEFVSQCIAEGRDRGENVDWDRCIKKAYDNKRMDIVRCIRDSGRGSVDTQLYFSCLLGDLEFVSQCIAEGRDRGKDVDWEGLMRIAYDRKHMDIVRCIRDSGRETVYKQLNLACENGDVQFVSQCIAEDRFRGPNLMWDRLIGIANDRKHMDIVRCIRDNGRGSVDKQLNLACENGDVQFVSQCIAEGRYREQSLTWDSLMMIANDSKHMDIVRCIRDNGRGSLNTQMYFSCLLGDLEFVSQCIAEDRDRRQNVTWEWQIRTAYDNKHMDIVRCIRDNGRGSVDTQLYYSCKLGDLEFVSQCIAEDRDRRQDVDWDGCIKEAYDNKHMDIVRCIRDSRRVSVDELLDHAFLYRNVKFVFQCIAEDRDREQNVDCERVMRIAYDRKHMDTVRCIKDNIRGSVDTHLYYSCLLGDLEFVSQCIAEDRDRGEDVNWDRLMETAYAHNADIAEVIVRSGRWTLADIMYYNSDKTRTMFAIKHTEDVNREIRPGLNTLHVAAYRCVSQYYVDKNMIYRVLNRGAKVNGKGYMGRTALHFLCHGQNTHVDNIIRRKTEPNKSTQQPMKKSNLPLGGKIIAENMASIIDTVIEGGGDVNATDDNGQTPLHLLCLSKGDVSIGTLLLERRANINARDNEGRTPLAVAAQRGNEKFVSFLCGKGCDKNMEAFIGQTPLYLSVVANNIRSTEILCKEGVNVNQANEYNVTPLAAACEFNKHQIVDLLLQHGADPNIADMEERTALHKAAKYERVESCLRLMRTSIDSNAQDITGFTALHLAALRNDQQIIRALLNNKCNVHISSNLGNIALHNAVATPNRKSLSQGNEEIVENLLQKGSDIDHRNNYGHTPIMISANALDFTMMRYLFDNNANLGLVTNMQRGLIHVVVVTYSEICLVQTTKHQKCQVIIEWLLENGLSINASDVNKQTPLHLAAQQGELKLVSFLVESGSDVTARDKFKHMPLMNALEHPEVFQYLWEKTLPAITEDDFCKLQRLSYWLDVSEEMIKKIIDHAPCVIDLSNMPQNVRPLKLRYDDNLEKWLKTENDDLPQFMTNWLPNLQPLTYIEHPAIKSVMWEFLNDLQEGVKKEDPLVAYVITPCGSVEEKRKHFLKMKMTAHVC